MDQSTKIDPHGTIDNPDPGALIAALAQEAILPTDLGEGIHAIRKADGSVEVVETPGYKAQREEKWQHDHADQPLQPQAFTARVTDQASFLDFLAAHTAGDFGTVDDSPLYGVGTLEVWADRAKDRVSAVLDGVHGWRRRSVVLALQESREWREWAEIDGKLLDQGDLAEFIEDHFSTIADPDAGTLLEVCQTLEGTVGVNFKQQTLLANGQRSIKYEEHVEAGAGRKGDLKVPTDLILFMAPYEGAVSVAVRAKFRLRVANGQLRIGVKLIEPESHKDEAFDRMVTDVAAAVPVPVIHGAF